MLPTTRVTGIFCPGVSTSGLTKNLPLAGSTRRTVTTQREWAAVHYTAVASGLGPQERSQIETDSSSQVSAFLVVKFFKNFVRF